jgi:hypothetical protein
MKLIPIALSAALTILPTLASAEMFGITIGEKFEGEVIQARSTPLGIKNYRVAPPKGQEDIWQHFEVAVDRNDRVCSFLGGLKIHDTIEENTEQDVALAHYVLSKAGRGTKESDAGRIRSLVAPGYRVEWENIDPDGESNIPNEIGHMLVQFGNYEMSGTRGLLMAIGKNDCFGKRFKKSEIKF